MYSSQDGSTPARVVAYLPESCGKEVGQLMFLPAEAIADATGLRIAAWKRQMNPRLAFRLSIGAVASGM